MFYLRKQHTYRNESEGEGDGGGGDAEIVKDEIAPEIEEKARKMGWTPKDEFKGDPSKWRDAAEFVERGENMVPILQDRVKKQDRKIEDLERNLKEFAEYHTKAEQRAYERAFRELKTKQLEAVKQGDTDSFVALDKEIADLRKDVITPPKVDDDNAVYKEWAGKNKWAEDDPELEEECIAQALYLRNKGNTDVGEKFLDAVAERVKKRLPGKFQNPRRQAAAAVEGASAPAKKGGKTFSDMPADARAACERMARNFSNADLAAKFKADYVKNHFEE